SKRVIELPLTRKQRLMKDFGLPDESGEFFKANPDFAAYFESIAGKASNPKQLANFVINLLRPRMVVLSVAANRPDEPWIEGETVPTISFSTLRFKPESLLELVSLVENKTISSSAAQQVFAEMFETGKSPALIVQEKGLAQVSDTGAIEKFCDEAIAANPNPVADYKAGKLAALNSLKGQVMKLSKGKANPALVGEILERKLKG
ncbi:MAG TPA: Asp-tRNA(Asn)/Glu-tRNA(Gln) amidotransferase GatCAB subunit B, partial [Verrucomicrobiae bacterium]